MKRRRRAGTSRRSRLQRERYKKPHALYVLADPRTGEIRYVGRTVGSPDTRLARHIGMAKENAPHPVHRWLWRLGQLGLNPILHVVGTDFSPGVELELCEGLVKFGARLLNIAPGGARKTGRIIVELEEIAGECHVDVIHLGITFRTPSSRDGRAAGAAAAFRKLAEILEGTNTGSHFYGTAYQYSVDHIEPVRVLQRPGYVSPATSAGCS